MSPPSASRFEQPTEITPKHLDLSVISQWVEMKVISQWILNTNTETGLHVIQMQMKSNKNLVLNDWHAQTQCAR